MKEEVQTEMKEAVDMRYLGNDCQNEVEARIRT